MKHNWKFVESGKTKKKYKIMFCQGDKLIKEFSSDTFGNLYLEFATIYERDHCHEGKKVKDLIEGKTIKDFISQLNHNAKVTREGGQILSSVTVMQLADWKRMQKPFENKD